MAADYRIHTEDDFDGLFNEIGNMFPDNIGNLGIGVRWLIGGQNALTPVEGDGFARLSDAVRLKEIETELLDDDIFVTGVVE